MPRFNFNRKSAIIFIIIFAVVFGGIYAGINYAKLKNNSSKSYNLPNEDEFRANLKDTLTKYNDLLIPALDEQYSSSSQNPKNVVQAEAGVSRIDQLYLQAYDYESQQEINKMWRDQITYFIDYTISIKNDDQEGIETAKGDLNNFENRMVGFFASKNATANKETLKKALNEYRKSVLGYIDAKNETNGSTQSSEDTSFKIGVLSDRITDAMYK